MSPKSHFTSLPLLVAFILGTVLAQSALMAQDFRITEAVLNASGRLELGFPAEAASYYRLIEGATPDAVNRAVGLGLTPPLISPPAAGGASFFRVEQIARTASLDSDGDQIPDVYELTHPPLNGLDAADAGADPDGNGKSALQEYQESLPAAELVTLVETSPLAGDSGVSVNREVVVQFSTPLPAGTVLRSENFFAGFGGRRFLGRVELSSDRRRATLFHLEPLPGGSRVVTVFDPTGVRDAQGRELDADGDGRPGGVALIPFDTHANQGLVNTAVIGQVFASELGTNSLGQALNRPLAGVTVTVDGAEETLRAVTDAEGRFTLSPAPSGRFFVHVDGRTAAGSQWPGGAYYPFIGKAWEAEPGRTNNLAGGNGLIYLPLIVNGALQVVSPTEETRVQFPPETLAKHPELAGVELAVPANSLFADNGVRGGRVGIAPVPPDRLPEPLPPGLNLPLVITVQTDGPGNFERAVPVRFPNVPDPQTGLKLAPGSKSALWSFNHDTGEWEIVGPMTVSADGKFVDSDPGVGIRQPGWHGTQPGVGGGGGPIFGPGDDCGFGGPRPRPGFDPASTVNGCGPASFPPSLQGRFDNPILAPAANFKPACDQHDIGYSTCGRSKQATDDQFLADMLAECAQQFPGLANAAARAACNAAAYAYYNLVAAGGGDAYAAGQKEGCADPETPPDCGGGSGEGEANIGAPFTEPMMTRLRVRHAIRRASLSLGEFSSPALTGAQVPLTGPHRYAIFTATGDLVQRGRAGSGGVAFSSLILAPDTRYHLLLLQEATGREGWLDFTTGAAGSRFSLPPIYLSGPLSFDNDADGLSDVGELVMGTNLGRADTDGDGITDGAEVRQGTNPLGDQPDVTGQLAAAPVVGVAQDVDALDGLVAVAAGNEGVALFQVGTGFTPTAAAQIDTPGAAARVALGRARLLVADGTAGVTIVSLDSLTPPLATLQVGLNGQSVTAVAALGSLGVAGTEGGSLLLLDLVSGAVLQRLELGEAVHDLAVAGDSLLAVTGGRASFARRTLRVFRLDGAFVEPAGSLPLSAYGPEGLSQSSRVFAADGLAYVTAFPGFDIVDFADPAAPLLVAPARDAGPNSFKQIVLNGTGLGLAAVGVNPRLDGTHDVSVYDTRVPADGAVFRTTLLTPGLSRALTLFNGLAYVADGEAGLQVLSYLPFDTAGQAPGLALAASFPLDLALNTGRVEAGKLVRLTAAVSDDVQVRQVEFLVDGVRVTTDGNYPFETRFITPALTATKTTFKLRARATDTGGNTAFSEEFTINLVEDATPPRLVRTIPAHNGGSAEVAAVSVFFSEPIAESSLVPANFALTGAGEDGTFGTADDVPANWPLSYEPTLNQVRLDGPATLVPGTYQLVIASTVTDVAGNPLGATVTNRFSVGFGLLAEYYDNADFTNLRLTRVDPTVNFDWGSGSPDPQIGPEQFSVRWRGSVVPRFTETYTFHTISDDGIRLWVDRHLLVDVWGDHGPTEYSGSITLEAGRRYDLRMEMYENGGGAVAQLLWSSPSQPREVIPASQMVPYEDAEGPYALWAVARPDFRGATLRFSEPLHRPSAEDPANYAVSGGREVRRATLQANNLDVLLETDELPATTDFAVTITGVRDASPRGNPVNRVNLVPFRTPRIVNGFARREVFFGIPGALLAGLKASPRFPLEPDRVELTPQTEVSSNIADSFGQRLLGWLVPPVTGDYQFYLSSDDEGELLLSTDESPANLRRLAFEPQWSAPRSWTAGGVGRNQAAPENISAPVRLVGGQRYYFEANAQEGSGGDHLGFTWSYRPEVQAGAFFIEAEDFDFDGGQHKPAADTMPYLGNAYDGAGAIAGVDFSKRDDPSDVYRLGESPNVGLTANGDSDRGTWTVTTNFKMGWNDEGEWMNYTRNFPAGTYHIYARLSSGGLPMAARLDEIIGGRGTAEQALAALGTFTAPATGNWDGFTSVPLRDGEGNLVAVTLSGERTLRFTVLPGNLDFNYLLLVPVPAGGGSLADVPTAPPPNGTAPIPAKFLQTWIGDDGSGQLRRDFFAGNADGAVDSLRNHPNYPDRPEFSDLLRAPEPPQGQAEFYGERVTGWLRPPVTGDYRFWVASDDQSELWLSTDAAPANLRKLAQEPVWAGFREFNGTSGGRRPEPVNRSELVRLEAGREYFFEVLHADHSGWDGLSVTWQMPGDYAVVNGQSPIAGNFFRAFSGPGNVTVLAPPLTQTVHEELPVTFRAHAVGLPPFSYQWFFKGEAIADATGPTYTVPFLLKANEGDYTVRIRNHFSEATSGPGTLTVSQDLTPPRLLAAEGSGSMERVRLRFDEEMDPATAQNAANYAVSGGVTVDAAYLLPDRRTVVLHTSRQTDLTAYSVTVTAVKDDSPTGNPVAGENSAPFTAWQPGNGILNREAYFGLGGGGVGDLTGSARFFKGPDEENTVSLFETPPNVADNYGVRLYGWLTPPADGDYRFFLASDDNGAVFLSTDESPANRRQIATEPGWRASRAWHNGLDPDPAQSEPIPLQGGKRYFIEALMKEGGGADNLAVTWQLVSSFAGAVTIEAEDFNFGGGQHLPAADTMPYFGGAYAGRGAVRDVDYHDPGFSESDGYRQAPGLLGNAMATDGIVQLTPNAGGQQGSLILAPDAAPGTTLDVQFELYIGDGSAADGFSFNYGELPDSSFGEQGIGAGLRVQFDTWANGSWDGFDDEANTIEVWYANTRIAKAAGIALRTSSFVPVTVRHDGTHLKVTHNGTTIFENLELPGWSPQANWRLGWGGRTGGASDNHWIRQLLLNHPATTVPPFDQPAVGIYAEHNDRSRPSQSALTNDWAVGWLENGDWMNYTRTFPAGEYYVLARLASGGAPMVATLSEVTDAGSPGQVATEIGSFNHPATGGWSTFTSVPLRNATGDWVKLSLGGKRTLRFTMGNGNANLNHFTVVPVGSINVPPAGVAGPTPPLNGSAPIGPEFISGYIPPSQPENPGNNAGGAP